MSSKIGRNKEWCKRYKANDTEKKNRRRRHAALAKRLKAKATKMFKRGMVVTGINKTIQHHESLAAS